jgi:hypothetical protein
MTLDRSQARQPAIAIELWDRETVITLSNIEGDGERSPSRRSGADFSRFKRLPARFISG